MKLYKCSYVLSLSLIVMLTVSGVHASARISAGPLQPEVLDNRLAVDGMIGWPKMCLLRDGTVALSLFNQPNHQKTPGDIELWVSNNVGATWQYRSTPARRERQTTRVNHAMGLAANGDLLVIAGGKAYSEPGKPLLRPWVCRSRDNGCTWEVAKEIFPDSLDGRPLVPFDNIVVGRDNSLRVPAYIPYYGPDISYIVRSDDDGVTWRVDSNLPGKRPSETSILHLGSGEWLAASRMRDAPQPVNLFCTSDDMRTWKELGRVTQPNEHPANLLMLDNGVVVLTSGNRIAGTYGADARLSFDRGQTFGEPFQLGAASSRDCGYPASIQLGDGTILTTYYAAGTADYPNYHVRVVRWRLKRGPTPRGEQ